MSNRVADLRHDLRVMGLVGSAHASSHFFHLILPPLFPILKLDFDVSFAALGLLPTLFYGASGIAQTIAGFLVDRFGARRVLLLGLTLLSISVIGYGFCFSFWGLMFFSITAGLGNSVFHPADLSILTNKISTKRLGKAYAIHAFSGNIGWALAPIFIVALASFWDWRTATILAGLIGLIIVLMFFLSGELLIENSAEKQAKNSVSLKKTNPLFSQITALLSSTVISCFLFFTFLAAALIGIQTFGVSALQALYALTLTSATAALTAFLIGSALGILTGGVIADKVTQHQIVAILGVALASLVLVIIGGNFISPYFVLPALALSGFFSGITAPSRDMLVRKITPPGASGRIFGFVYSGLDLGSSIMPLLAGALMDGGKADMVFYSCALMFVIAIITVLKISDKSRSITV